MHRLAAKLTIAPPALADRIEALLAAPARLAFDELHRLESEVLALVALHMPDVDLTAAHKRAQAYAPAWV
jgi:hypothetical protein